MSIGTNFLLHMGEIEIYPNSSIWNHTAFVRAFFCGWALINFGQIHMIINAHWQYGLLCAETNYVLDRGFLKNAPYGFENVFRIKAYGCYWIFWFYFTGDLITYYYTGYTHKFTEQVMVLNILRTQTYFRDHLFTNIEIHMKSYVINWFFTLSHSWRCCLTSSPTTCACPSLWSSSSFEWRSPRSVFVCGDQFRSQFAISARGSYD